MGKKSSVTVGMSGNIGIFVKVNPSQGYGDKLFQVVGEDKQHYRLHYVDESAQRFMIYKAHTYRDAECIKRTVEARNNQKEKNAKIGTSRKKGT